MTIITKPLSDKKGDKLVVPLVENDQLASAPAADLESQSNIFILPSRAHRVSARTTLYLLLTALFVVSIGILGGIFLYRQYMRVERHSFGKLEGWAQLPYTNDDMGDIEQQIKDFLQEKIEIDEQKEYERINVPDFRDDRNGRFIHDFNTNITCIIDTTADRCFVMPLDRKNILPPKSLFDLIHKMWEGYYKIDTTVVKKTMRVVTPPITDLSNIGPYITRECGGRPVYKLEKFVGGVVKRSAELHPEVKFAQFAGKGIVEFDIVNMEDADAYEKSLKQ